MYLFNDTFSIEGEKLFVDWVIRIFSVVELTKNDKNSELILSNTKINVANFSTDTLMLFYKIFQIKNIESLKFNEFHELLYYSALELELFDKNVDNKGNLYF